MKPKRVEHRSALVFGDADGDHLCQAALVRAPKVGMGLYLVEDDDAIGLHGVLIAVQRYAVQLTILDHLHGRQDGHAHALFRDVVPGKHLELPLCRGTGMAPHRGDDERAGAPFLEHVAHGTQQMVKVGYAATAGGNANALAGIRAMIGELLHLHAQMRARIPNFRSVV